jgi:predicted O-methyltransferase YrrM
MTPIASARNIASLAVDFITRRGHRAGRDDKNVEICLSSLCKVELLAEIRFPVAYVEFLRTCIEHTHCAVKEVKGGDGKGENSKRFGTLLEVLRSSVPPIEFSVAAAIALIADHYQALRQSSHLEGEPDDISLHFQNSSSFGYKGRILSAIVRTARTERCVELGTAYGMSALFILEALRNSKTGHLITLEGWEALYSLSSTMLKERYGGMVSCELGKTQDELPRLAKTAAPIDFLFHDAGHLGEDYIRDFNAVIDSFAAGAVILIDDIRYQNQSYDGWVTVCADPRVQRAAEIDYNLGLLLLR